ncbi:hypothetical protein C0995_001485, partial [Termitomyces sp. Mi166
MFSSQEAFDAELFLVRRFKPHFQVLSATSPAIMDIECYLAIMAYIICLLRLCYYPLPPTPRNTPGSPIAELPWAFNNRTREWYLPDPPKIIRFNNSADLIIPVLELLKDPVAAEIFFSKLRTDKASQPSAHPAVAPVIEEETNTASIHNAHLEKPAQDEIETATTPTHLLASPESVDLSTAPAAQDERVLSSLSDETRSVKLGAL